MPSEKSTKSDPSAEVLGKMHFEVRHSVQVQANKEKIDNFIGALKAKSATGDYVAFQYLYATAFEATQALQELATEHVEAIQPFIRRKSCWPVLCCPGKAILKEFETFLDDIQLGDDWPIDLHRFAKTETVARRWLFKLIRTVDVARLQQQALRAIEKTEGEPSPSSDLCKRIGNLPQLSKQTADEWFAICWEVLLENTGRHPELVPDLRKMGEDSKSLSSKSPDSIILGNIKGRFQDALASIIKS